MPSNSRWELWAGWQAACVSTVRITRTTGTTPREFEADDSFYRTRGYSYWFAEILNLYVGFYGWAKVDYVFSGPMEQGMYPLFVPDGFAIVYQDEHVTVLDVR